MHNQILILLVCSILLGCSVDRELNIASGYYGVKTNMGEFREALKGPGTFRQGFTDHVIVFPENQNISLQLANGAEVLISINVVDPEKFYWFAKASYEVLSTYLQRQIVDMRDEDVVEILMAKLSRVDTGVTATLSN